MRNIQRSISERSKGGRSGKDGKASRRSVSPIRVASQMANTYVNNVLYLSNTALSSVTAASDTAVTGAQQASATVRAGADLVGTTALTSAATAVTAAALAATTGVGTVGQAGQIGLTGATNFATTLTGSLHGSLHGSLNNSFSGSRRGYIEDIAKMDIFCSDLYTDEFVLEEIQKAKKNPLITKLTIEDLVMRDNDKLMRATLNLVSKSTMTPRDEFDEFDDDEEHLPSGPYERDWGCLTFCDCIGTAEDYQFYTERKKEFQGDIRRVLKKKGVVKMPIKFTAKIEMALLDMNEMVDLLQEIEHDKTIIDVQFPYETKDAKKLPAKLLDRFDELSLQWKEGADPVEIHIKYGTKKPTKGKRATHLVKQCSIRLEHIVMSLNQGWTFKGDLGDSPHASSSHSTGYEALIRGSLAA
ncbi:expressed unknown protein [Seminavis robusta]|uniref:Uncharacterized protein n=1 Tax=Seminavis robusta TaxID=568900 RepID=A0A9N8DMA5_9STRA|nr:expressed unknown protein [Seminavis robusta]|eukprot:Sro239_g095960.1 n/a (414) ;mRNA; r:61253-62590